MWQDYIGKELLVKRFEDGEGYGEVIPHEMYVIKVMEIPNNEIAKVMERGGDSFWVFPSSYTVLAIREVSDSKSELFKHIGQNVLLKEIKTSEVVEYVVIKTKGDLVLIMNVHNTDSKKAYNKNWVKISDYEVVAEV